MKVYIPVLMLLLSACGSQVKENKSVNEAQAEVQFETLHLNVEGMTCQGCEQTIQANVMKIEGVNAVSASHTEKSAAVKFNPVQTDTSAIIAAIVNSGYSVNGTISETEHQ